ncbi:MAG: glutamine amidotransferase [Oscillospiraceae bacterium]|nr:glutamine amidotransferase [Oscillospiraceae bacterium]
MMELKICHLYPDVLNLYGDRGNIACMRRRLEWRGIGCAVTELPLGTVDDLTGYDLFFIGGGQDFEQTVLLSDLNAGRRDDIRAAAEDGKTFLCICGGYQLLGRGYRTADGEWCDYTGILDFVTEGSRDRMIGNYAFRLGPESGGGVVVGFENHGGRTRLGSGLTPLGAVLKGCGNNGQDGTEGVRYRNVFGTYSHGPVLPKNPAFCDGILLSALVRKYGGAELAPLEDAAENAARRYMLNRLHVTE